MKGVYVIIIRLDNAASICIGKLGKYHFKKGYYAYIGSARGTGGFKRVRRHFDVASGKNFTRKWHIDHLLPYSTVECALLMPVDDDLECEIARIIGEFSEPIPDFGCSDCNCRTHLYFNTDDWGDEILKACKDRLKIESIIIYPNM